MVHRSFWSMRQTGTYPNVGRSATKNWTKRNQEDIAFCNATTQYTQDMNAHQQAAGDLYDARQRRNNTSGPARWMANREVGKAEAVLDQLPAPVKPLEPEREHEAAIGGYGNLGADGRDSQRGSVPAGGALPGADQLWRCYFGAAGYADAEQSRYSTGFGE